MKSIKVLFLSVLGFCITLAAYAAYAAEESTTISVSANVIAACSVSTSPVTFVDFDTQYAVHTTGQIDVTCTNGLPYNIALDAGANYSGGERWMRDGTVNVIWYTLAQDDIYTIDWGDSDFANTTPGWASKAGTGTGAVQAHTVYAVLTGIQEVPVGTYNDTVTVTVHY